MSPGRATASRVEQDGTAELVFTHASDYVIAIDTEIMGSKEEEGSSSGESRADDSSGIADTETKEKAWNYKWIIVIGAFVVVVGSGVVFIYKRKK